MVAQEPLELSVQVRALAPQCAKGQGGCRPERVPHVLDERRRRALAPQSLGSWAVQSHIVRWSRGGIMFRVDQPERRS